jgi:1,4-dihydroxy-2-naphthoyl-CoA hydrolase
MADESIGSATALQTSQEGTLPGLLGFEWLRLDRHQVEGRFDVKKHHLAPTGFLHAATVVALADAAAGFGCLHCLPEGTAGFTTAELKTNFLGTCREGGVRCVSRLVHGGRTTQVWDAEVRREADDKLIALYRCTQILLRPEQGNASQIDINDSSMEHINAARHSSADLD